MNKRFAAGTVAFVFVLAGCSSAQEGPNAATAAPTPSFTPSFYMGVDPEEVNYYSPGDGYQAALDELPSPKMIPSCSDAFELAASIAPSDVNDAEMYRTVRYCANVTEWKSFLESYPKALGVGTSVIDDSYADSALVATCLLEGAATTLVCEDAGMRGLLPR